MMEVLGADGGGMLSKCGPTVPIHGIASLLMALRIHTIDVSFSQSNYSVASGLTT